MSPESATVHELVLPAGWSFEDLEAAVRRPTVGADAAPPAAPPAPPPPVAAPPPPVAPEASPPGPRVPLAELQKERRKRQDAQAELLAARAITAQEEAQREAARQNVRPAPVRPIVLSPEARTRIAKRLGEVTDLAQAVEIGIEETLASVNAARTAEPPPPSTAQEDREAWARKIEDTFKADHPDYEKVLLDSGIAAGLQIIRVGNQNVFRNAGLARIIGTAENPAAKAYELGQEILKQNEETAVDTNGDHRRAEPPAPAAPAPVAAAPVREVAPPAAAPAPPVHDAGREAGLGLRRLPSSGTGPVRVGMTAAALDHLRLADPNRWVQILENNPELDFQYMTGGLT